MKRAAVLASIISIVLGLVACGKPSEHDRQERARASADLEAHIQAETAAFEAHFARLAELRARLRPLADAAWPSDRDLARELPCVGHPVGAIPILGKELVDWMAHDPAEGWPPPRFDHPTMLGPWALLSDFAVAGRRADVRDHDRTASPQMAAERYASFRGDTTGELARNASDLAAITKATWIAVVRPTKIVEPDVARASDVFLKGSYDGHVVVFDVATHGPLCHAAVQASSSDKVSGGLQEDLRRNTSIAAARQLAKIAPGIDIVK